jgi:hypothetical protein
VQAIIKGQGERFSSAGLAFTEKRVACFHRMIEMFDIVLISNKNLL